MDAVRLVAQIILSGIDQATFLEETQAAETVSSIAIGFMNFFIGLVFTIQTRRLICAWLPEKSGALLIHIVSMRNVSFRNFIAGQAAEAVILGTLCTIGMLIFRLPYAPMVGALVGVTALIPIVGAYIGAIAGAFLILTVSPLKAFIFIIFLIVLQQLEGNLIYPKVVGSRVNLPSMWVLAAVTVGGNLAGPAGMLPGVPAASADYELLKEATIKRELKSKESKSD